MRHAAVLLALLLAACNTVEGIGRDVEAGGRVIQKGADSAKDAID